MSGVTICRVNRTYGIFMWSSGYRRVVPSDKPISETDVLAQALWLERHGRSGDADTLIDYFCEHNSVQGLDTRCLVKG